MKKTAIILCLLAFALSACKPDPEPEPEPAPNNGGQNNDTTETVVKKYLVKEYYANVPDQPIRIIEWNEDYSKIIHITTNQNSPYQLDYSFDYFEDDSIRVVLSKPDYSYGIALFSNYTCRLDKQMRISNIDYYINSEYQSSQKYNYDSLGKLKSIVDEENNTGIRLVWEGNNVHEIYSISSGELTTSFADFTQHIHPDYMMPYLFPDADSYGFWYLTKPLWKNWYNHASDMYYESMNYEFDKDGYVTCTYYIDEEGGRTSIINYEYEDCLKQY
ncbi:MAG: hypothetical protein IKM99_07855 [Bacteroidales bacterium]|nr:hypothetical protein [Bacteroidales bacterium]